MAINALTPPKVQFFDDNGDPLALGKVYTYEPGTTTPKASYSDSDGTVANTNPVILDSRGEASIYLDGSYKIVVKTSADVTVYTVDNFTGAAGFPVNDTVSIVQDPADNTKQVRIDAGSITTGTTRVLTMPDADVSISSYGATLVDDADAATARTTLGLGTAAVEDVGTSGSVVAKLDGANVWSVIQDFSTAGAYFGTAAAANLLDDYEEGTFTPTVEGSTTAGTCTYLNRAGYYTKVGRQVFVHGRVDYNTHTGSGNLRISGLPFSVSNVATHLSPGSLVTGSHDITWTGGTPVPMPIYNTAYMEFSSMASATAAVKAQIGTNGQLYYFAAYWTD